MKKVDFLPLGSVVLVRGGVRKIFIVSRGLSVKVQGKETYFDYRGCYYPEGLVDDSVMYFNHDDIIKVIFEGLKDDDNTLMVDNINEWLENHDMERGNAEELTAMYNEEIAKANQS